MLSLFSICLLSFEMAFLFAERFAQFGSQFQHLDILACYVPQINHFFKEFITCLRPRNHIFLS